jgi:F-type H+-transporting ATPase subunit delta
MSNRIIAKRYASALCKAAGGTELDKLTASLSSLTPLYSHPRFVEIVKSPLIAAEQKAELVIEALEQKSPKLENLIRLLAQKRRLMVLPLVASELESAQAARSGRYRGTVHSATALEGQKVDALAKALSSRLGKEVALSQGEKPYDGVKVSVDDLGLEVDFSKTQIRQQILGHILKGL